MRTKMFKSSCAHVHTGGEHKKAWVGQSSYKLFSVLGIKYYNYKYHSPKY